MRYALLMAVLLTCGACSRHWSASYDPLAYPPTVGYERGVGIEPATGPAVMAPVVLLTEHERVRDCHPEIAGGMLYFASDRDGNGFNIYRKRLNERAVERLTDTEGDEHWPRISCDGRWMAFGGNVRGHWDLYLIDLQTVGAPQLLTIAERQDCVHPCWAPDGSYLVYSAFSPTLDTWVIRGISFGESPAPVDPATPTLHRELVALDAGCGRQASRMSKPKIAVGTQTRPISVPNDVSGKAVAEPASLRTVSSHWNLLSAGNAPLTGLHPDYATDGRLVIQDYRRDDRAWYSVKLYDAVAGLTSTLAPPHGYGAIQPRFTPDGSEVVYLTSAKAGDHGGDGIALCDRTGNVLRDIRNPCGQGEISDPTVAEMDGKRWLIFVWICGGGESICMMALG